MKRVTLFLLLPAVVLSATAAQIEDLYWQQHRTNDPVSSGTLTAPKQQSMIHGITEIGIERTPCFGSCPAYVCIVRSDGTVRYHGDAHAERVGDWEAKIDTYAFHQLANFIVDSAFLELPDTFASNVTDGSSVYTTFVSKGRRKVFRDYAGSGPPKLWALEQLIDGLSVGAAWKASTAPMGKPESKKAAPDQSLQGTRLTPRP